MTKTDAAGLLGVSEEAPVAEVRRRYESLHNDYQIRLTNAPTPALKKTYQQKLQELGEAGETLHPGLMTATVGGDLPSTEPMIVEASAPRASSAHKVDPANRSGARGRQATRVTEPSGLPRSTVAVGIAAVILAAALSFIGLRWWQVDEQLRKAVAERETLAKSESDLKHRADAMDRLMYADRLRVRNLSKNVVRISAAAFVYRDASGAVKLAHSGNYDYPSWDIRPGGITTLDPEMARGRLWDGAVLYYALLVEYPGVEPFLKAGVWADDIDRLDKVVTLDLD